MGWGTSNLHKDHLASFFSGMDEAYGQCIEGNNGKYNEWHSNKLK